MQHKICAVLSMHEVVRLIGARWDWKEIPEPDAIADIRHDGDSTLEIVLADNEAGRKFAEENKSWLTRDGLYLSQQDGGSDGEGI